MKKRYYIFFIIFVILLSFLSFYHAFNFAFIVDDWFQLWGVFYDRSIMDYYIRTQHPNSAYEFLLFAPIFKFNPFYYQIIGYMLKIAGSLSVALLVFSITKSRKSAFFSGLIFAASVVGIETFSRISAQNSALLIPSLCLGLYFWIEANRKGHLYRYLLSLIFMILTIMADPGVGVMILPVAFLWNLLNFIRDPCRKAFKKILLTTSILALIPIFLRWYLDSKMADRGVYLSKHFYFALQHIPMVMTNFLTSVGNLLVGWIIPIKEHVGLANPSFIATISGYLFISVMLILGFIFMRKRVELLKIILFFLYGFFYFIFRVGLRKLIMLKGGRYRQFQTVTLLFRVLG